MDIRVLRYFLAVAQEESITRAAETLHIAQPSLSKQIKELETELGKQLFVRGSRCVTLTEDGALLCSRAEELVALFDRTEQELTADTHTLSGTVTIGGGPTARVLRAAAELRRAHPGVQFAFHSGDATDVAALLEHGSLDFAVMLHPVDSVKYDRLLLPDSIQWGLLLRRGDPLAAHGSIDRETLVSTPLILHRRAGLQRRIADWAQVDVERLNIAATYNVIQGSHELFVKSGLGALLTVREFLSSEFDSELCFRPLDPPLIERHAFVWKRHAALSRAARAFLDEVRRGIDE